MTRAIATNAWTIVRVVATRIAGACVCAATLAPSALTAQESEMAVTHHQVMVTGSPLRYTARAGFLPIRNNDAGDVHGRIFFVAYTMDRPAGALPRPLTFVWNGGPGSNSTLVHLVGFGPRRLNTGDDPAQPSTAKPFIEDNPDTWLAATDLVFVDPIGTGYSRPASAAFAAEFYSVLGDIAATAEFIRVYRTTFDAFAAPLFLAGESYGVWRAAGVAEALEQRGQKVAGVMLISGGIPVGPVADDAVRTALFIPNRTAAALHHGKLGPDLARDHAATLREVERWALDTYAPAWARRDSLPSTERERIVTQLARYTGVEPAGIDAKSLAVTSPQFRAALLRDRNDTIGRYDMRLTHAGGSPVDATLVLRYFRNELRFATDLAYQGLETGYVPAGANTRSVGARWEWNQAPPGATVSSVGSGDGPPGGSQPWLKRAMLLDPALKAFVAAGLYDSLNSCADNAYIVAHVEATLRDNFTAGCYRGGHMMYDVATERRQLARDVATFVRRTSGTGR